jgi:predicted ATPase
LNPGLNVLIGANGAGKSNLIGVFKLLERMLASRLQDHVGAAPDRFLFHGSKLTPELRLQFDFASGAGYECRLKAQWDSLVYTQEAAWGPKRISQQTEQGARKETMLNWDLENEFPDYFGEAIRNALLGLSVHHFHDTSASSPARRTAKLDDNRQLRPDGSNLPAFLHWMQHAHKASFDRLRNHVRLVAPFFDEFQLAPLGMDSRMIKLEWRHRRSEANFDAHDLSDGSLRFICLAALLLQPEPPPVILLDEPELGLHPAAIGILADMLHAATGRVQLLLATQSPQLLDRVQPEDVIVVDHDGHESRVHRLDAQALQHWLEAYRLGEIWQRSAFGGEP